MPTYLFCFQTPFLLFQFSNKLIAQVACDVLQLLVSYWQKLQEYESSLSRKITEVRQFKTFVWKPYAILS